MDDIAVDDGVLLTRHRLDVDDYHRMGAAGILTEDDRVELIDGEIIDMAPIGWDHASTVNGFTRALVLACEGHAVVSVQNPVRLDRYNEPQPDFAVLRHRPGGDLGGQTPGATETLLVIEVSNSSLRFDRTVKLPLYARMGVPEVWIVDVKKGTLEAFGGPVEGTFTQTTSYGPGDKVTLSAAPGIALTLERLLR